MIQPTKLKIPEYIALPPKPSSPNNVTPHSGQHIQPHRHTYDRLRRKSNHPSATPINAPHSGANSSHTEQNTHQQPAATADPPTATDPPLRTTGDNPRSGRKMSAKEKKQRRIQFAKDIKQLRDQDVLILTDGSRVRRAGGDLVAGAGALLQIGSKGDADGSCEPLGVCSNQAAEIWAVGLGLYKLRKMARYTEMC